MARQRISLSNETSKGLVLDLIRAHEPISRVRLANETGLTQASMTTLVRRLIAEGLVEETGSGASTGGKRPRMLSLIRDSRFAIGVQIDRESTTYVMIDLSGEIVGRMRSTGVGVDSFERETSDMACEINRMISASDVDKNDIAGVGLTAPGPINLSEGTILPPSHLKTWCEKSIDTLAEKVELPVILENDANAAALGDFWTGEIRDTHTHAIIYMGVGIGAGIVIDGSIFRGSSSNAGEIAQLPVIVDGQEEPLEQVVTPGAVVQRAQEKGVQERLGISGGTEFNIFRQISIAAMRGDAQAHDLLTESAQQLARAVTLLVNLFDLDSVSLAGPAFVVAGSLYAQEIIHHLDTSSFARSRHDVKVQLSTQMTDSAAVGGATLVLQEKLAPRTLSRSDLR